jgi:hypothetical protein
VVPELAQGAGLQAGDVHLGDAELSGDFLLGEVAVEAQDEDALLAAGQCVPVAGHGLHVHRAGYRRVVFAQQAGQPARAWPPPACWPPPARPPPGCSTGRRACSASYERILGFDHPDTLDSRNNLALAYQDAGRTADAKELNP